MSTGENDQGYRAIFDFIRLGSIFILIIHFYVCCYGAFQQWGLSNQIIKNILLSFGRTGVFNNHIPTKGTSLLLLSLSIFSAKGKKDEKQNKNLIVILIATGLIGYFSSYYILSLNRHGIYVAIAYMAAVSISFIIYLAGITRLSRILKVRLNNDIFNEENETFPQEERLMKNSYSVNLPALYRYKGKVRSMWVNLINAARMVLIIGSPGAGKTYFIVRNVIKQKIEKRKFRSMLLYDFKYDDLAIIAYNAYLKSKSTYKNPPKFYIINFDTPIHRCNPLEPSTMVDITDASESARTVLLGLNMEWIKKTGDFFVESAINFVTATIWFLKKYQSGKYCTLAHVIELMSVDYEDLFPILSTESEIEVLINPFISAFRNNALEQLEGQVGSAKIALARLASPLLYYVLSDSDFTLDLNNPEEPKILVLANNPEKTQIYGAVLSLYLNRIFRILPKKNRTECAIIIDEFSSLFANGIESFLAICRSYKVFVYLAIQNLAQLRRSYGKEQADVIFNLAGNILCGQATSDTAKAVSEAIGKIVQTRESVSINRNDTSISRSTQLDYAVPAAKISQFSAGEFAGILADNPDQILKYKAFHAIIQNNHKEIQREESLYESLPKGNVTQLQIQNNFTQVKNDITILVDKEITRIKNDPNLAHLIFEHEKSDEKK